MLVVSRRNRERVVILLEDGREIWVTLIDTKCNGGRIGIQAPREIGLFREELYHAGPPPGKGEGDGKKV